MIASDAVPSFSEREESARSAWQFFSGQDAESMTHHFRGWYHQGVIDTARRARPVTDEEVLTGLNAELDPNGHAPSLEFFGDASIHRMRNVLESVRKVSRR